MTQIEPPKRRKSIVWKAKDEPGYAEAYWARINEQVMVIVRLDQFWRVKYSNAQHKTLPEVKAYAKKLAFDPKFVNREPPSKEPDRAPGKEGQYIGPLRRRHSKFFQ